MVDTELPRFVAGRGDRAHLSVGKCQRHIIRRAGGMGDANMAVFVKYKLPHASPTHAEGSRLGGVRELLWEKSCRCSPRPFLAPSALGWTVWRGEGLSAQCARVCGFSSVSDSRMRPTNGDCSRQPDFLVSKIPYS